MTTTIMRDSIVGDSWIAQTAQAVPIKRVVDPATGQLTGDILTGPVRLSFVNLFTLPQKKQNQTTEPKYGSGILFTPYADFTILQEEYYKILQAEFQHKLNPQDGQYYGVRSPFRAQAEKGQHKGYTPGCVFMTCTSKFKPPIVDARGNPIVDQSKVYAGVWAICSIRPYAYKEPSNQGVGFGLQSVMIIGDDTPLAGGGAPDTNKTFAGVSVSAPIVRPEIVNGMPMGGGQAPAAPGIAGYTHTGAPQQAAGFAPPAVPQTGFTPPQPSNFQPQQALPPQETEEQRMMREMMGG